MICDPVRCHRLPTSSKLVFIHALGVAVLVALKTSPLFVAKSVRSVGSTVTRTKRSAVAPADGSSCFGAIAEAWQDEAQRCWGDGLDGPAGFIAQMLPAGRDYSQHRDSQNILFRPQEQRRWETRPASTRLPQEEVTREADFQRALRFFLDSDGGGIVADIGCGDGYFARRFAKSGSFEQVIAIDLSWAQLEMTRDLAERMVLSPTDLFLAQADAEQLPFRSSSLDCAVWAMGMHLVDEPAEALASICRSLRPGGRLFATGFNSVQGCASADDLAQLAKDAGFMEAMAREEGGIRYALLALRG